MARRWGRFVLVAVIAGLAAVPLFAAQNEALAGATAPLEPAPPPDPSASSRTIEQGAMVHIFDTTSPYYVNDHTIVQAADGTWHLFGIYHREPFGDDSEVEFIHAMTKETDPALWRDRAFDAVAAPYTIALTADRTLGETHVWAPHVIAAEGRYWMMYQGGGSDGDRASIRLAESTDLYEWKRIADVPLFEDICVARDPMLTRRDNAWVLYYTRCDSTTRRTSGVAYRLSRNLVDWTEPRMVLTLEGTPAMPNSGFTESPFVFERGGYYYLSVSSYPLAWDATMVYRSPAPFAFPSVPHARLRAHAAEWITGKNGRTFMTHAGAGQRGVWLSTVDL
jgi:hypothetical protein